MVTASAFRNRTRPTFGRRVTDAVPLQASSLADDLRLFATFFIGGFTFMGVYLA